MRTKLSELKRGDKFSFLPKSKIATYTFIKPVGKKFHYVTTTNLKDVAFESYCTTDKICYLFN